MDEARRRQGDPFRVRFGEFEGPLDLLLHLVRKHEVEVEELPLAQITGDYVETLSFLRQIEIEPASEFLEVAATLIRMKARSLLPDPPVVEDPEEAAAEEAALLQQLVEHQVVRMAADRLRSHEARAAAIWFRGPTNGSEAEVEEPETEIVEADLFSLVTAFKRVMEDLEGTSPPAIEMSREDFPVPAMADGIRDRLESGGPVAFETLFRPEDPRAKLIATFLALLELVRSSEVRALQEGPAGTIMIFPRESLDPGDPEDGTIPAPESHGEEG